MIEWYDIASLVVGSLALVGGLGAAFLNNKKSNVKARVRKRFAMAFDIAIALAGAISLISTLQALHLREEDAIKEKTDEFVEAAMHRMRAREHRLSISRLDRISDSLVYVKSDLTKALGMVSVDLSYSVWIKQAVSNLLHNTDTIYLSAVLRFSLAGHPELASDPSLLTKYLSDILAIVEFYDERKQVVFAFASLPHPSKRFRLVGQKLDSDYLTVNLELPLIREHRTVPVPAYYEMSNKRVDVNIQHVSQIELMIPWQLEKLDLEFLDRKFILNIPKKPKYYQERSGAVNVFRMVGDITRELKPKS